VYVQAYDASGATVVSETRLYSGQAVLSQSVTIGQKYFIIVRPYSSSSGTYQIGLNTVIDPGTTVTPLTENVWTDGNLPTVDDEQWFKFTATASTQYIHVSFLTLPKMWIYVFDSNGVSVGSESTYLNSASGDKYISRTVTVGQVYYVCVDTFNLNSKGTFKIGFTKSTTPPAN